MMASVKLCADFLLECVHRWRVSESIGILRPRPDVRIVLHTPLQRTLLSHLQSSSTHHHRKQEQKEEEEEDDDQDRRVFIDASSSPSPSSSSPQDDHHQ